MKVLVFVIQRNKAGHISTKRMNIKTVFDIENCRGKNFLLPEQNGQISFLHLRHIGTRDLAVERLR
jgi:hypothetical protein